jgi:AcrR family transcriptional regulator
MSARAARGKAEATGRGRAERKRGEEVLDAAARVFARRGYADASVQDIADELAILKGSLYQAGDPGSFYLGHTATPRRFVSARRSR